MSGKPITARAKPARVPEAFRELRWKDGPPPVLLQPVVPLQIGIYDLFAVRLADDVDPADLRAALKWHCSTTGYLQSLARHDSRRHDPDGRAVEKIGDDVRLSVKLRLQDRFARRHVRREKVTSVIEAHRAAAKAGGDDGPGADGALGRPPVRLDVGVAPRTHPSRRARTTWRRCCR